MEKEYMARIKNDYFYLEKVIKDIQYLLNATKGVTKEQLEENETLLDSVMFRFIQISENLKRVLEDFKNINNHIPWNLIIALRNKIVHEYGKMDLTVIYDVLQNDLNMLLIDIKKIA